MLRSGSGSGSGSDWPSEHRSVQPCYLFFKKDGSTYLKGVSNPKP